MMPRSTNARNTDDDAPVAERRQVPTLLIGLGGVGSKIVERIYARIPPSERARIATHVFDTDVGDLSKLQYATTNDRRTAIGTDLLVGELRGYYPDVNDWLPYGGRQLEHRSTLRGAGQIRLLSRLSLKHALRSSGATNLRSAMHRLNLLSSRGSDVGVRPPPRVWVFCSLAGGTGAGAFISVGLLARRLVQQMIGAPGGFTVNGVFVLPDVLTKTNKGIPPQNWEAMRANAQASIREIEAINASLSGLVDPLRLELDENGGEGAVELNPFDYAFLFDHTNDKDQYLGSGDAYEELVARAMHLLLFSPMGTSATSAVDNLIRAEIAHDHMARYVAPASSSLVFPRQDLVAFLAARWGAAQIHDLWLAPDRSYAAEHAKWKKDLKNHKVRPEPDQRERYVAELRSWSEAKNASAPFFRSVVRQAHVPGHQGAMGSPRGRAWVDAIEEEVRERLDKNALPPLGVDRLLLRSEGGLRQQIEAAEQRLRSYRTQVLAFSSKYAASWAAECVTEDHNHANVAKAGGEHRLNYWMFEGEHAVHPLAVRYVLYGALSAIEARLGKLRGENEPRRMQLLAYENRFDDPGTPDVVERVDDHITAALRGGFLGLGRQRTIDRFAEDYEKRSSDQYALLVQYLLDKTLEDVLAEIQQEVQAFAEAWEGFFKKLEAVRDRMELDHERARERLDAVEGSPVRKVLASELGREDLWKRLTERASDEEPADVATATYRMLYARHCSRRERAESNVVHAFHEDLTRTLVELIDRMAVLPSGIAEALAAQARLEGLPLGAHAVEELELVRELAEPWVQTRATPKRAVSELYYWGLHPAEAEGLDQAAKIHLGIKHSAVDHGYDRDEVIFFAVPYLLKASDLFMFTPGVDVPNVPKVDGAYFAAFQAHQQAVRAGQITAHLDHRWDNALPDFWDEGIVVRQAVVQGLALGVLEARDGRWQAVLGHGNDRMLIDLGSATGVGNLRGLMNGLAASDRLREVTQLVKARLAEEIRSAQKTHKALQYHEFVRRVRGKDLGENLFVLVGDGYFGSVGEESAARERWTQALFLEVCETLRRYTEATVGDPAEAARGTWNVVKRGIDDIETTLGKRRTPRFPKSLMSSLRSIADDYRP